MGNEPKTQRGRASRDRIVERAAELIADHGVEGTSLEAVLVAAGVSKSQLYHYFTDRDQLVAAAVARRCEHVLGGLTQTFAEVATLTELDSTLAGFIAIYEQNPSGCPIGTIAAEVADRNEAARVQVAGAFASWEHLFEQAFERMRARGGLRADSSSETLATALLASIEGGLMLSQTRRNAESLRTAVSAAMGYLRTFAA